MSAYSSPSPTQRMRGFSLVEMMVALVFVSILMIGMFRVFAASTSSFMTMNETLGIQRNARWGLQLLQDEVLEAGYMLPVRNNPGGMLPFDPNSANQPPILFRSTGYTPPGATAAVDELQIVMDVPLPIQGTAAAAIAKAAGAFRANIPAGAGGIEAGDLIFAQDAQYELLQVAAAPGTGTSNVNITVVSTEAAMVDPDTGFPIGSGSIGFSNPHVAGMPFSVIRPSQVVRYTVAPRKLDPADPNRDVPCLIRQTRAINPTSIMPDTQAGEQVLLENVIGFRIDCSIDGGRTWLRPAGGNDWAAIGGAILGALQASGSPFIQQALANPMWTLYTPVLLRMDLQMRTEQARTEYNPNYDPANPQSAFRTRRETLMLSPRNFGIGLY